MPDATSAQHLLLLPPPPWPVTQEALQAAYRPPLTSVLKHVASQIRHNPAGAKLDIALPLPWISKNGSQPSAVFYDATQAAVAGVYKLVCVIAAIEHINVEDSEGIDARIILLDYPRDTAKIEAAGKATGHLIGPVIDLKTLANSQRPWQNVYSVESEQGETILRNFVLGQDSRVKFSKVPGGIVKVDASADADSLPDRSNAFDHFDVILGGTWDHIHIGHKLLLTMFTFVIASANRSKDKKRALTIGTTGDELLKNKKFPELLESWSERQKNTLAFMRAILDFRPPHDSVLKTREVHNPGPNGHAVLVDIDESLTLKFVEIWDPYGPTITDPTLTAIVISAETRSGGKAVNEKRKEKGWSILEIFEVDVLDAQDGLDATTDESFSSKLSSTTIRQALSEKGRIKSKA